MSIYLINVTDIRITAYCDNCLILTAYYGVTVSFVKCFPILTLLLTQNRKILDSINMLMQLVHQN